MAEPYEETFDEFIRRISDPINIVWQPLCSVTEQFFTLGGGDDTGTDYDIDGDGTDETAPFKDKLLVIYGLRVEAPGTASGASIAKFTIDGKDVLGSTIQPTTGQLRLDGYIGPGDGRYPNVSDRFGGPLYCRRRIGIRADASDEIANSGAWATVRIWGFYVDRRF